MDLPDSHFTKLGVFPWEWDTETNRVKCHPALAEFTGLTKEQLPCHFNDLQCIIHPDDWKYISEQLNYHRKTKGARCELPLRIRVDKGFYKWGLLRGVVVESLAATTRHFSGVLLELSHDEIIEQAVSDAREQSMATDVVKREFVAAVTHELRTPLAAISGMTELMLEDQLSIQHQDCVTTIHRAVEELILLVNDLLDFAKIEAGRMELIEAPFHLRQTLAEVDKLFEIPFKANHITYISVVDQEVSDNIY